MSGATRDSHFWNVLYEEKTKKNMHGKNLPAISASQNHEVHFVFMKPVTVDYLYEVFMVGRIIDAY